ncbi:MAG: Pyruvate synthase subunit PorD [Syntrophus sp. PtaU1.Bin208]|nr:MAG: Pyruvate synthase subunit PorD [Syntrophus sp. PtaU1.Bin208]
MEDPEGKLRRAGRRWSAVNARCSFLENNVGKTFLGAVLRTNTQYLTSGIPVKEIVVVSGRDGAGKTSIVASFAVLAERKALADCDVEAANLHLILSPTVEYAETFSRSGRARIVSERCIACGLCMQMCRFGAISSERIMGTVAHGSGKPFIHKLLCRGCGLCLRVCPEQAIDFEPCLEGQMFVSKTDYGPMVHASLGIGMGNAGKLVAVVRKKIRSVARERGLDQVIIDGSPGISFAVNESIAGADLVLAVFEPSISGESDLLRLSELTAHFQIPLLVCVNKWDLNRELTGRIEELAMMHKVRPVGRIRYDQSVTHAMIARKSVVEFARGGVADDIRNLWRKISES